MIDHFMNGNGSDYRNETLTAFTYKHESTQRYINGSKNRIIEELRLSNGNLNSLQFFQPPTEEYDSSQFLIDMKNIGNPRYNTTDDLRNGLTLCINDTWGNRIEIKNYKYDGKRFSGTIHYTVYDHFGLDPEDMEKTKFFKLYKFKDEAGFASWFILQHYEVFEMAHKPFVTYLEYEESFEGVI